MKFVGDSIRNETAFNVKSGADVYCRNGTTLRSHCEAWVKPIFTLIQSPDVPEMIVRSVRVPA